jgi:hypothetical protein
MLDLKITHKAPKKKPNRNSTNAQPWARIKTSSKIREIGGGKYGELRKFPMGNRACLGPFFHLIKSPQKRT